jgi:S1-C subfamily serine protease
MSSSASKKDEPMNEQQPATSSELPEPGVSSRRTAGSAAPLRIVRHHVRAALAALVALVAIGGGTAYAATRATSRPIGTGVVVIDTNLAYQNASAAGTGIVLTSSGEILTNNHVIAGATTIRVVVPKTTHTYTARVVGYSTTADVAVLQLQKASNLKTVKTGNASNLKLGARVTAVGNAGGTGTLTSSRGTVTGLNKTITVQDDNGATEQLTGLIETNATLQPGDSGGPLLNSVSRVVGIDTAASSSSPFAASASASASASNDGYAIPIGKATTIAKLIVSGKSSSTVHVGATAFLGVELGNRPSLAGQGATIVGVVSGGPAAAAGLVPGDVITAAAGRAVSGPSDIEPIILAHKPGEKITVTYTDASGQSQTATITLAIGPPQ